MRAGYHPGHVDVDVDANPDGSCGRVNLNETFVDARNDTALVISGLVQESPLNNSFKSDYNDRTEPDKLMCDDISSPNTFSGRK